MNNSATIYKFIVSTNCFMLICNHQDITVCEFFTNCCWILRFSHSKKIKVRLIHVKKTYLITAIKSITTFLPV